METKELYNKNKILIAENAIASLVLIVLEKEHFKFNVMSNVQLLIEYDNIKYKKLNIIGNRIITETNSNTYKILYDKFREELYFCINSN